MFQYNHNYLYVGSKTYYFPKKGQSQQVLNTKQNSKLLMVQHRTSSQVCNVYILFSRYFGIIHLLCLAVKQNRSYVLKQDVHITHGEVDLEFISTFCFLKLYRVAHNKPDYVLLLSKFCISTAKNVNMIMYMQHQEHQSKWRSMCPTLVATTSDNHLQKCPIARSIMS